MKCLYVDLAGPCIPGPRDDMSEDFVPTDDLDALEEGRISEPEQQVVVRTCDVGVQTSGYVFETTIYTGPFELSPQDDPFDGHDESGRGFRHSSLPAASPLARLARQNAALMRAANTSPVYRVDTSLYVVGEDAATPYHNSSHSTDLLMLR